MKNLGYADPHEVFHASLRGVVFVASCAFKNEAYLFSPSPPFSGVMGICKTKKLGTD